MSPPRDTGMTLVETVFTIAIAGILMAIGFTAVRSFLFANREQGTAQQIRSALRNAEEQTFSQGRTYCVYFTSSTWATYKSDAPAPHHGYPGVGDGAHEHAGQQPRPAADRIDARPAVSRRPAKRPVRRPAGHLLHRPQHRTGDALPCEGGRGRSEGLRRICCA